MAASGQERRLLRLRPQGVGVAKVDRGAGPTGDVRSLAECLDVQVAPLPPFPRRQRLRQGQDLYLPETVNTFGLQMGRVSRD